MARDIMKMKRERDALVTKMRARIEDVETRSDKKFNDTETSEYNGWQVELDQRDSDIKREERLQSAESGTSSRSGGEDEGSEEFRSLGDFLHEVRFNEGSGKLNTRAVTAGSGSSIGFTIPDQFDTVIRSVTAQSAIVRPRALIIPAGDPPDGPFTMTSLDQSGSKGVFSGVVVSWIGENADRQSAGDPTILQIKLEPHEVGAYIDISDKALRNASASGALVEQLLRQAIIASEDKEFFSGNGIAKPLGIIGHKSAIKVKRKTANSLTYGDLVNMLASMLFGGNLVWVVSQSLLAKLMTMEDTEGHLIWQPSAREGQPNTLLGYPVVFNQRSPRIGSNGDIALVDFNYYAVKDGSPLAIFMDPYTQKKNGLTRIYAYWNVDGQPRITSPLKLEDGVGTVSPFVTLDSVVA